jgi:hypothetical protein
MQKRYKVISPIEKKGGGVYWMRTGNAFTNRDDSINVYIDLVPKNFQFQLRELTEEELARKASYGDSLGAPRPTATASANPNEIPF